MAIMTRQQLAMFSILKDVDRLANKCGGGYDGTVTPQFEALLEDIAFDMAYNGKIETGRLIKQIMNLFSISRSKVAMFTKELYELIKMKGLFKELEDDQEIVEAIEDEQFFNECTEIISEARKARAPKLTGRAEKSREAKAKIMKELNKDPQLAALRNRYFALAQRKIRKIAKELGVRPNLVNITTMKIRKG